MNIVPRDVPPAVCVPIDRAPVVWSTRRSSAPPPSSKGGLSWGKIVLGVLAIAAVAFFVMKARDAQRIARIAEAAPLAHVVVYGPASAVQVKMVVATMALHGVDAEVVSVANAADFERTGLFARMDAAGMSHGSFVMLPIVDVGGELVRGEDVQKLVEALPKVALPPQYSGTYVVVYGRAGCSATASTKAALDQRGIPYEYRDIGRPEIVVEAESRLHASGNFESVYALPIVEVNGVIEPHMKIDDIAQRWRGAR
jgi:glutaredoxin